MCVCVVSPEISRVWSGRKTCLSLWQLKCRLFVLPVQCMVACQLILSSCGMHERSHFSMMMPHVLVWLCQLFHWSYYESNVFKLHCLSETSHAVVTDTQIGVDMHCHCVTSYRNDLTLFVMMYLWIVCCQHLAFWWFLMQNYMGKQSLQAKMWRKQIYRLNKKHSHRSQKRKDGNCWQRSHYVKSVMNVVLSMKLCIWLR